jgi:6-pyruvoyltetrahydropterin/6-carboxytetrahydropterin synthase
MTITKEFSFEMSHQLEGYPGKCNNIHGHSYRLQVSVAGTPVADANHPFCGMIMDFSELKNIVNEHIVDVYDHSLVLKRNSPLHQLLRDANINLIVVDYQPTCENLLSDFAGTIQKALPAGVSLSQLRLYESATAYAEIHL